MNFLLLEWPQDVDRRRHEFTTNPKYSKIILLLPLYAQQIPYNCEFNPMFIMFIG